MDGLSWTDAVQDASKHSKNVKVYNCQTEINEIRASLIKSTPSKNSNVIKSNLLGLKIVAKGDQHSTDDLIKDKSDHLEAFLQVTQDTNEEMVHSAFRDLKLDEADKLHKSEFKTRVVKMGGNDGKYAEDWKSKSSSKNKMDKERLNLLCADSDNICDFVDENQNLDKLYVEV